MTLSLLLVQRKNSVELSVLQFHKRFSNILGLLGSTLKINTIWHIKSPLLEFESRTHSCRGVRAKQSPGNTVGFHSYSKEWLCSKTFHVFSVVLGVPQVFSWTRGFERLRRLSKVGFGFEYWWYTRPNSLSLTVSEELTFELKCTNTEVYRAS